MVVGSISRTSPDRVLVSTDEPSSTDMGLEVRIAPTLHIKDRDYGLAVVSCRNVVDPLHSSETLDLSKLELIAFFSFMDPTDPTVPMSSEIATWHFNTLFKRFVKKSNPDRIKELLHSYDSQSYLYEQQSPAQAPHMEANV